MAVSRFLLYSWLICLVLIPGSFCEDKWDLLGQTQSDNLLGKYPHSCVGDLSLCSEGFTLSIEFESYSSEANHTDPEYQGYVITTGAENAMANGVYVKRLYSVWYEVLVGIDDLKWTVHLQLPPKQRVMLTIRWLDTLDVFVDGFLSGSTSEHSERMYIPQLYNAVPGIMVAKHTSVLVYQVIHYNRLLSDNEIIQYGMPQELGCIDANTTLEYYSNEPMAIVDCRKKCFSLGHGLMAYRHKQCACTSLKIEIIDCSNYTDGWMLSRTSSMINSDDEEKLVTSASLSVGLYSSEMFDIGEQLTLHLTSNYDDVLYKVDFGDGYITDLMYNDLFSHVYNSPGIFVIYIIGTRNHLSNVTSIEVKVSDLDIGDPPKIYIELVMDKLFTEKSIQIEASVHGDYPINCTLEPLAQPFIVEQSFYRFTLDYVFHTYGTYWLTMQCSNRFGMSELLQLPVRSSVTHVEQLDWQKTENFRLEVPLFDTTDINLMVDGGETPYTYTKDTKTMSFENQLLQKAGDHIIEVFREDLRIFAAHTVISQEINDLVLLLDTKYIPVGSFGLLYVQLEQGEPSFIDMDFNNGTKLSALVTNSSGVSKALSLRYTKAGSYYITVKASNSRGYSESTIELIVEEVLLPVTVTVENIISVNDPAIFRFSSQNDGDAAVVAHFLYDMTSFDMSLSLLSGDRESVLYYFFYEYGVHDIQVNISNHVSFVMANTTIKVGEEIDTVDVATVTEFIGVYEDFILDIYCPRGSALMLNIDFGDGTVASVLADGSIMDVRSLSVDKPNVTVTTSTKMPNQGITDRDDLGEQITESAMRIKRAVVDLTTESVQTTEDLRLPSNEPRETTLSSTTVHTTLHTTSVNPLEMTTAAYTGPEPTFPTTFQVIYKYSFSGHFPVSVNISNHYNFKLTSLCPVLVYDNTHSTCNLGLASPINSSYDFPLSYYKSEEVMLNQLAVSSCSDLLYWIKIEGYIKDAYNEKRISPLKELCPLYAIGSLPVIKPRSLDYGRYKVTMTTADSSDLSIHVKTVFHVKITPSPLIAWIKKGSDRQVLTSDFLPIDISTSGDPDHDPEAEDTDIMIEVFCYPEELYDIPDELDRSEDLVSRNLTFFYDSGCFHNPDYYVAFDNDVFRLDAGVFFLNTTYSFVLRVAKDRREAFFIQRVQPIVSNITSLDEVGTQLDALLASGDNDAVLFVAGRASSELNNVDSTTDSDDAKAKRAALRSKIIEAMSSVAGSINNFEQLSATTSTLKSVTQVSGEVSPSSKNSAAGALLSVADATKGFATQSTAKLSKAAGSLVNAVSNLMPDNGVEQAIPGAKISSRSQKNTMATTPSVSTEVQFNGPIHPDDEPPVSEEEFDEWDADNTVDKELYEYFTDEELEEMINFWHPDDRAEELAVRKAEREAQIQIMKDNDKSVATKSISSAGSVSDVLLSKDDNGDEPLALDSPKLSVKLAKAPSNSSEPQKLDSKVGGFSMPPGQAGEGNSTRSTKFFAATDNPYNWDSSASTISGALTIEFSSESGEEISVNNMTEPIELNVKGLASPPNATLFTMYTSIESDYIQYHKTPIDIMDSSVHITIYPQSPDDVYQVYWAYDYYPNTSHYDYTDYIPNSAYFSTDDDELLDRLHHTFFPPQQFTAVNGSYYLGLKLVGEKVVLPIKDTNHSYSYSTFISGCKFFNKTEDKWSSNGCVVGNLTYWKNTQCLCTHLTSFGGDVVVPPNTINFATVFQKFKNLGENAAVFSTIVSVFCLWLISLVWARHQDRKDILKWGALPLEDNLPTDRYHYQVSVHTGVRQNASTTSNVCFILSGDDGDTGARRLSDGKRPGFHRATIKNFILSVDRSLGSLTFLRIWHDNSGKGKYKSWYLNQIQVTNLQTGEKNYFVVDRWLAVEEDDGMVDRLIPVAGVDDLTNFSHLFSHSLTKKLTNDHLWISVISRPTKSSFTRCQRISCCVSLLFLTMITNCMFFKAEENVDRVDAVSLGPFTFTLQSVFISVVSTAIVFPVNFVVIFIFRRTRSKDNRLHQSNQTQSSKYGWRSISGSSLWGKKKQSKSQKFKQNLNKLLTNRKNTAYAEQAGRGGKQKKKMFTFPHWVLPIGWILCVLSILASGFFTILYSMEWGPEKSMDWLTTFLLSFFQSVIIVQPVKVFLLVAFISCVLRKPDLDEEQEEDDSMNNTTPAADEEIITVEQTMQVKELLEKRKALAASMKPPDYEALAKAKKKRQNEMEMEQIIKDMIVYFLFICVLLYLSYENRSADGHPLFVTSNDIFWDSSPKLDGVRTIPGYWQWVDKVLVPGLYRSSKYNGDKRLSWREALATVDPNIVRVGVGRLRQQRLKQNDTCMIRKEIAPLINHCRNSYNWVDDDVGTYKPFWSPVAEDDDVDKFKEDGFYAWKYRDSVELKNAPYAGKLALYKGGGFTAKFGRTLRSTERLLAQLKSEDWIDVFTRAIFAEFTLFNANTNLFISAIILSEFMNTGGMVHKAEFKVFRLYSYVGSWGLVTLIMQIIYLAFTIFFLYHEIKRVKLVGFKRYLNDFWNMVEFSTLFLSVFCVVCYIMKQGLIRLSMSALEESGSTDFVNFQSLALYDEMLGYIMAFVVFVSTVKSVRLLRFNKKMGMLGATIRLCTKDLKPFSITAGIYMMAFAQFAFLIFSSSLESYGTFVGTLESLFAFALGDFDFVSYKEASILGSTFFLLYVAVVFFGLMSMFVTIICEAFALIKEDTGAAKNDYEIVDFMVSKFKKTFGIEEKEKVCEDELRPEEGAGN